MSETAALHNYNADPTTQATLSMAYETEHGMAYSPINPRTGEAVKPQEGIHIDILEQWAADEVATEISSLEVYLSGEGDPELTLEKTINNLSNLAVLHIKQEHVDAIKDSAAIRGDGGWRWTPETASDSMAYEQIKILSDMMMGNDTLSHFTSFGAPLLRSGALKPKAGHDEYRTLSGDNARIRTQGTGAVKESITNMVAIREQFRVSKGDSNAKYTAYLNGLGLHSQLVHFGENEVETALSTTFYYPRSAIMDRAPIAIIGQDAANSGGVPGIKSGGDEAHHDRDLHPKRDRLARVNIEVSPELQSALQPRKKSHDITFMAATDTAEHAVDFEYPIEEAAVFVKPYDAQEYIVETALNDEADIVLPESVHELCAAAVDDELRGVKAGGFSLNDFSIKAVKIKKAFDSGKVYEFASPRSESFWNDIVGRITTMEKELINTTDGLSGVPEWDTTSWEQLASTALLRRVMEFAGHNPEWTNQGLFMANQNTGDGETYDKYAVHMANEMLKKKGNDISYIQAKAEDLQFDQLDLAMQLPVYKS